MSVPAKAAHGLRWLLKPLARVTLVLTVPGLACDFPVCRGVVVAERGMGCWGEGSQSQGVLFLK